MKFNEGRDKKLITAFKRLIKSYVKTAKLFYVPIIITFILILRWIALIIQYGSYNAIPEKVVNIFNDIGFATMGVALFYGLLYVGMRYEDNKEHNISNK